MKKLMGVIGVALLVGVLSNLSLASTSKSADKATAHAKAKTEAVTIIPLTNMLVDGKKIWLPAEIKAPRGKVKFILNNTLDVPHGFQIPGVMKEGVVVPGKKSVEVPVVNLSAKQKYELKCHMHPTHVSAFVETY